MTRVEARNRYTHDPTIRRFPEGREEGLLAGRISSAEALKNDALDVVRLEERTHGRARNTRKNAESGW